MAFLKTDVTLIRDVLARIGEIVTIKERVASGVFSIWPNPLWHSHPQNFPFERDPACFLDAGADEFAQAFEIGGGGLAPIDQKIAMKF